MPRRHRDERGAALVELAFVLPILVLFVFGIVELGRAYSARIELTAAVREGARAVALGDDGVAATKAGAPGLDLNAPGTSITANTCAPSTTNAEVSVSYPFDYTIPLVRSATWTLKAKGVMRCGG
jgi:Flp pilus assembly protein TadG